jgi:hypothetical protein
LQNIKIVESGALCQDAATVDVVALQQELASTKAKLETI